MLKFIGTGSAFNTELGNNGAFIKKGNKLLLIDCGSNTFDRIRKHNLLDGVDHIHVLLTHTHPDHIGSLGDLIFYGYYAMGEMMKPNVTVLAPKALRIDRILELTGVDAKTYNFVSVEDKVGMGLYYRDFQFTFQAVPVTHVSELHCYGYIINHDGKRAYYSGDSNMIPHDILDDLNLGCFDYFYQDTCKAHYDGNVHLSLNKLNQLVNSNMRDRVYCMHLDGGFVREEAEYLGFNVVKNEF